MSRRRSIKFLSVLAAASIVVAACGDDDDDDAVSEGTSGETTAGTEAPEETTAGTEAPATRPPAPRRKAPSRTGTEPEPVRGGEVGGSACGEPHGPYEEQRRTTFR